MTVCSRLGTVLKCTHCNQSMSFVQSLTDQETYQVIVINGAWCNNGLIWKYLSCRQVL